MSPGIEDWFLTHAERGNGATAVPVWTEGNLAEPLVHGATYFDRLVTEVEQLGEGDHLFFTDWRGDPDERLRDGGPTVGGLFSDAARRGVCVRGLVWRSHWDKLRFSGEQNRALDLDIEQDGGQVILDQRVHRFGSHHQKLVVIRRRGEPERDVAFAGGIDLCHGRRDDGDHAGDPQPMPMRCGLRPDARVARRAAAQYMWSRDVARLFAEALRQHPDLHLVVVVPRIPDQDGAFAVTPNHVGRDQAIETCRQAGGERVHVFDVENSHGVPVYVHAKVCVVDDVWASVGSDNFNRRSWTHDSELSSAVLDATRDEREPRDAAGTGDGARVFARDLRLQLAREHLDRAVDGSDGADGDLVDPADFVAAVQASAQALDAWHAGGRAGPRPPGRLRPHRAQPLSRFKRAWATPVYRIFYDPDGRSMRMRRTRRW